jgi:hypothetical protein
VAARAELAPGIVTPAPPAATMATATTIDDLMKSELLNADIVLPLPDSWRLADWLD